VRQLTLQGPTALELLASPDFLFDDIMIPAGGCIRSNSDELAPVHSLASSGMTAPLADDVPDRARVDVSEPRPVERKREHGIRSRTRRPSSETGTGASRNMPMRAQETHTRSNAYRTRIQISTGRQETDPKTASATRTEPRQPALAFAAKNNVKPMGG